MRVLIVDDCAQIQRALKREFERAGWLVETAGTGAEGADLIENSAVVYDAVVSDWQMPGGGGGVVVSVAMDYGIPVLVVSSSVDIPRGIPAMQKDDLRAVVPVVQTLVDLNLDRSSSTRHFEGDGDPQETGQDPAEAKSGEGRSSSQEADPERSEGRADLHGEEGRV